MAIENLFGPSVAEVQELRRLQQEREIAGAGSQFGAFAPLYQAGLRFGNQTVQGLNTLMGAQDPMLKKATDIQSILTQYQDQDLTNADVLTKISKDLAGKGYAAESLQLAQEAVKFRKERKFTTVAPGATVLNEKGEVVYEAPSAEKMVKTPADFAAAGKELGFGVRVNIGEYSQQETQAINNLLESRGIKRAEAGVPRSGEVKVPDIRGGQDLVATYTKVPQDRLAAVRQIRVSLAETKGGVGAALPQLRRDLVKLVGDNQIGQGEVQQALGSVGIVGDAISGINQLFTGVPSQTKLKDVEKFIDALEQTHAKSYNRGREQAATLLKEAKLPEGTQKALLPPAYTTAAEKKGSKQGGKFTEGKIYVDAKGNRARYVNGNFVSVE
jgi:flagellar hook assembly protein FlgD